MQWSYDFLEHNVSGMVLADRNPEAGLRQMQVARKYNLLGKAQAGSKLGGQSKQGQTGIQGPCNQASKVKPSDAESKRMESLAEPHKTIWQQVCENGLVYIGKTNEQMGCR